MDFLTDTVRDVINSARGERAPDKKNHDSRDSKLGQRTHLLVIDRRRNGCRRRRGNWSRDGFRRCGFRILLYGWLRCGSPRLTHGRTALYAEWARQWRSASRTKVGHTQL